MNVGLRCDLACHHCHVEAGPKRTEALDERLARARARACSTRSPALDTLDLTGGAPELNPHFRALVRGARALGRRVIDRCNLTVLFEPGQEDTAEFLAREGVDVVASLPCYTAGNVDAQRGKRVYERSIEALRRLNALGYGAGRPAARPRLQPARRRRCRAPQAQLEADYRRELGALGIRFDRLLTLTNMPIKRFARDLARRGESEAYLSLLVNHFNPATVDALMCRSTLSVAFDGQLYDCDFNQALELPLAGRRATLFELDDVAALEGAARSRPALHCFGCTAGAGSSCGGALAGIEGA